MSFNQIRNQLLSLQNQLSGKLSHYSSFATAPGSRPSPDEETTSKDIEDLIARISDSIESLGRIVHSDESISTSKMQQWSRHKESLNQFRMDYHRIQSTIQEERNRLNLISNVRTEIQDRNNDRGPEDAEGYLMDERMRINRQHGVIDTLIGQVMETRDQILGQRGTLNDVGSRLQQSLGTIPGINALMGKIGSRRRRNTLIIATVIVVCIVALWFLS
ncbi:DEKNAAC101497 [Brettanomyces naardenensis]|uniref:Golgi SNAP receptor complex member 1 n=1 Tax=Brettanomyces naardenensis TaxID=13370 RepID=A0A448YI10_BRENA|nr:DEKNAAC101497 [Brettanomyces naardenensis]